ncbi:MAG: DUF5320 domain-containing protein [Thermoguttaceae bacterium]|jgi:hypothetical protein
MPGGDRTGPMGMGPMTGRGAGFCAGFATPGFVSGGRGFFGRGRGGGRGWRNMFYATGLPGWARMGAGAAGAVPVGAPVGAPVTAPAAATGQEQLDALKQQAQNLADMLDDIRQRISQLESGASE